MYYRRHNPYWRRNSDAAFRAAEQERRNLGLTVGDYIKYLIDESRDPDSEGWEFHDVDYAPRQVTELLDQAFGEESVVSYLPVVHWSDLTHHAAFDGEHSFTFGDAEVTLVWPITVIRDIRYQEDITDPEIAALIRELDSLQLRRVLIGF